MIELNKIVKMDPLSRTKDRGRTKSLSRALIEELKTGEAVALEKNQQQAASLVTLVKKEIGGEFRTEKVTPGITRVYRVA